MKRAAPLELAWEGKKSVFMFLIATLLLAWTMVDALCTRSVIYSTLEKTFVDHQSGFRFQNFENHKPMEGSPKRSIPTEEVSESYLEEMDRAILNAQHKKFKQTGKRVYAVAKGRTTGLFNTWKECEASISRFSGAVHESFASVEEANQWLEESLHQVPITSDMTVVYIDGACKDNQAGIGVWFGDNDKRNLSEPLTGNQTNQRAELTALIRVLEVTSNEPLHVLSDSEYCVSSVNYRLKGWVRNNFASVQNLDLWQRILALLNSRQHPWVLCHVAGHSGNHGNDMADRLAVAGMQ